MRDFTEREDKWEVDDEFVMPDLDGAVDDATVHHDRVHLISTYVTVGTLRRRTRKADHRLATALKSGDGVELYRARKAAKRERYTAELLMPADKKTNAKAKRYKRIQSILGDHQDTVVARDALRRIAVAAGTAEGENGFTFGLLHAHERELARESRLAAVELL